MFVFPKKVFVYVFVALAGGGGGARVGRSPWECENREVSVESA